MSLRGRFAYNRGALGTYTEAFDNFCIPSEWTWSCSFNESVTATFAYVAGVGGGPDPHELVESSITSFDLQLMYDNNGTWVSLPNSRMVPVNVRWDPRDTTGRVEVDLVGVDSYDLSSAYQWDRTGVAAGKVARTFATFNAGALALLIDKAQGANMAKMIVRSFNSIATTTAGGWSHSVSNYDLPVSTSVYALLQQMVSWGWVDYRMRFNTWDLYNAGDPALQRNLTSVVTLMPGREIISTQIEGIRRDFYTQALTTKSDSGTITFYTGAALGYRSQPTLLAADGVPGGTLASLATYYNHTTYQITHDLGPDGAKFLPVRDYMPGDLVTAPGIQAGNPFESMRVQSLTLNQKPDGSVAGNVVVGDKYLDRQERLSRILAGQTALR